MWRNLLLSSSFIALFLSLNVQAATTSVTTTRVIVTPAPQPKEVVVIPQGYQNCFTVAAGWYKDVWVPEHQVCQYASDQTQGVAWVNGYWSCNKYNANNDCTNWLWVAGHWVKTLEVY